MHCKEQSKAGQCETRRSAEGAVEPYIRSIHQPFIDLLHVLFYIFCFALNTNTENTDILIQICAKSHPDFYHSVGLYLAYTTILFAHRLALFEQSHLDKTNERLLNKWGSLTYSLESLCMNIVYYHSIPRDIIKSHLESRNVIYFPINASINEAMPNSLAESGGVEMKATSCPAINLVLTSSHKASIVHQPSI